MQAVECDEEVAGCLRHSGAVRPRRGYLRMPCYGERWREKQ
jgi:hypothetical protein